MNSYGLSLPLPSARQGQRHSRTDPDFLHTWVRVKPRMLPSPRSLESLHIYTSVAGLSMWPINPLLSVQNVGTVVSLLPALLCVLPCCSCNLQLQLLPLHRVCWHRVTEVWPQPAIPLGLGTIRALMDDVRAGSAADGTGGLQERQVGWSKAVVKAAPGLQPLDFSCQRREKETHQQWDCNAALLHDH